MGRKNLVGKPFQIVFVITLTDNLSSEDRDRDNKTLYKTKKVKAIKERNYMLSPSLTIFATLLHASPYARDLYAGLTARLPSDIESRSSDRDCKNSARRNFCKPWIMLSFVWSPQIISINSVNDLLTINTSNFRTSNHVRSHSTFLSVRLLNSPLSVSTLHL